MKSVVYHLFKDIVTTFIPSDNKTGPDIGVVIGLVIVGIIIILVIGKYYAIILNIILVLINSIDLFFHHIKEKIKQEK